MDVKIEFHNNLSTIMGRKRLNIAETARISGVHRNTLYRLYHNKTSNISFDTLGKLCYALECTPNDILGFSW